MARGIMVRMARRARSESLLDESKVEAVELSARRLVTIGPDHPWWAKLALESRETFYGEGFDGAIVRVRPPGSATDGHVEEVRSILAKFKVAAMRFESRAHAEVAPQPARRAEHKSLREVVMEMAATSSRREELRVLLDYELAKVGQ